MDEPHPVLEPLSCADCVQAGRPGIVMRVIVYEQQWMNVSLGAPDSFYPGAVSVATQRKKCGG